MAITWRNNMPHNWYQLVAYSTPAMQQPPTKHSIEWFKGRFKSESPWSSWENRWFPVSVFPTKPIHWNIFRACTLHGSARFRRSTVSGDRAAANPGCCKRDAQGFRDHDQWPFQEPKLEVPTIYKAYFWGLNFRGYTPKKLPNIWY